jgi:exopolysaccharide production protein ExoQ
MAISDFIQYGLPITLVLLFAIAFTLGVAGAVHTEPHLRAIGSAILPTLLLAGFTLSILVSGRNATLYGTIANLLEEPSSQASSWVLRLATAAAVGGSIIIILAAQMRKSASNSAIRPLFLAFCGYFFAAYVASGLFGTVFAISHKTFYPFVIVCALYLTRHENAAALIRPARDALHVFLLLGLLLIPIAPDLVRQAHFSGLIPVIPFRYWGLTSHANNVGPLAVFFLLLVYWVPYGSRWLNIAAVGIAFVTIVLSQSKTAYVVSAAVAGVFVLRFIVLSVMKRRFGTVGAMVSISLVMGILAAALLIVITGAYEKPLDYIVGKLLVRNSFLTGREVIWSITIGEWERSPLFGYGPEIWGDAFSAKYGYLGVASNAHNQLLDTLGASGYLGITFFIIYFATLWRYALLLAPSSKWVSVALLTFMTLRCITEVPFKTINVTTSDFFMHTVLLGVFMRAATAVRLEKIELRLRRSARHILVPA